MRIIRSRTLLSCLIVALSMAPAIQAQNTNTANDTGFRDFQTYDGEHEQISLGSGNVLVTVPLLSLPGRNGMNYSVGLLFNSQSWSFLTGSNPNVGLSVTRTGAIAFSPTGQTVLSSNSDIKCISGYHYTDESGGVHAFSAILTGCYSSKSCQNQGNCLAETSYNDLGSFDDQGAGIYADLDPAVCRITNKDGSFTPLNSCSSVSTVGGAASFTLPYTYEDANGNQITSGASGGANGSCGGCVEGGGDSFPSGTDTDTLGRKITFSNDSIQYLDSNGAQRTITFGIQSLPLSCTYKTSSTGPQTITSTVNVISSATLPDGLTYIFQYDTCGNLSKIVYPSGGYTRYQYDYTDYAHVLTSPGTPTANGTDIELTYKYVCPTSAISPGATSSRSGNTCPVTEQMTAYSPTVSTSICNHSANTVVDPVGNTTVYQFMNYQTCGYAIGESQRQVYQGSSTLMRTVQTTYAGCAVVAIFPQNETTILPNGLQKLVHYDYPGPGCTDGWIQDKIEYDWSTSPPNPTSPPNTPLRETVTPFGCNWKPASETVNQYVSQLVNGQYQWNPVQVAQTVYQFDGNGSTPTITASGAVQHDSTFNISYYSRCNITAIEHWRNTDGAMLTTTRQYDDAGNVVSSTDPLGINTATSFADSWGSATCAPANDTPPLTGNAAAYPTTITVGNSGQGQAQLITQHTYNSCTGTVASTTDPNSQTTTLGYDLMDRRISTTFPDGGSGTNCFSEVSTEGCYSSSYPISIRSTQAITATTNKVSTTQLDGLARVSETQLNSDPSCSTGTKVDTVYDADGRKSTVSNPYCGTPTTPVTTYGYDGMSRVISLTHPDATSATTSYDIALGSTNCQKNTDENGNQHELCDNGMGQMTSVLEPSGASQSATMETDYTYDDLNNLLSVTQWGGPSGGSGAKSRSFTYDSLSELLTSSNPESGTVCYGQWNKSNCTGGYDNDGNLMYKTDARGLRISYNYDSLNRLVYKTYPNDTTSTPWSFYQYGTSASSANTNGRLINEWSMPSGTAFSSSPPASGYLTLRSIPYYDKMGRVISEQQCVMGFCTSSPSTASAPSQQCTSINLANGLSYCYDLAGDLTVYGNGLNSTSFPQQAIQFTQGFDSAGRLTSVVSSLTGPQLPASVFTAQSGSGTTTWCSQTVNQSAYTLFGALQNWSLGTNLNVNRAYDCRLRVNAETATQP